MMFVSISKELTIVIVDLYRPVSWTIICLAAYQSTPKHLMGDRIERYKAVIFDTFGQPTIDEALMIITVFLLPITVNQLWPQHGFSCKNAYNPYPIIV